MQNYGVFLNIRGQTWKKCISEKLPGSRSTNHKFNSDEIEKSPCLQTFNRVWSKYSWMYLQYACMGARCFDTTQTSKNVIRCAATTVHNHTRSTTAAYLSAIKPNNIEISQTTNKNIAEHSRAPSAFFSTHTQRNTSTIAHTEKRGASGATNCAARFFARHTQLAVIQRSLTQHKHII